MTTASTVSEKPKKTAKRKAQAKKTQTRNTKTTKNASAVTDEQRMQMIRDAAYYRALNRDFVGGSPEQDWIEAEAEISARLTEPA